MFLSKISLREVKYRPNRALLTLLSIAIAIAAIVAVSLGTATTQDAYRRMYEELAGRAALQITAVGQGVFDASLAARLQEVPGVQAAVPSLQRLTVVYFEQKRLTLLTMGIDPSAEDGVRPFQVREGRNFTSANDHGALLEIGFAQGAGIRVGDDIKVMASRGWPPLKIVKVVGLLAPSGAAGFNQGGLLLLPLGLAERYFTIAGKINTIDLVLRPGADEAAVTAAVKQVLPAGLEVHSPASRTQLANESLVGIQQGLHFASDFALALAAIIIINTFLMNVSERRRQLAILRAVGATRGQVVRMFLVEALVLGILGTALGCLLGAGGGYVLMRGVIGLYTSSPPPIAFSPLSFLPAAALGPTVAMIAACFPALRAATVSPLEAMQPPVAHAKGKVPRWLTASGAALVALSGGLLVIGLCGWLPPAAVAPLAVVAMASIVLLIPWLAGPLGAAAGWLLAPLLRLEGRLAQRQMGRRPVRTALTMGVLYLAVSLGIGEGTTIINNVNDVHEWYRQTMLADFVLRGCAPIRPLEKRSSCLWTCGKRSRESQA